MPHDNSSDQLPHPQSLAATSRAAFDLVGNLRAVLDWFDCIRAADRDVQPIPLPWWWDGYATSDIWRMHFGRSEEPNRSHRITFARMQTEEAIDFLIAKRFGPESKWKLLTDSLRIPTAEHYRFAACENSLRNLKSMIGGGAGNQLFYQVPPEDWHLEKPLPNVWTPMPETEEERTQESQIDAVLFDVFRRTKRFKPGFVLPPAAQRKLAAIRMRVTEARTIRHARNEVAEKRAADAGHVLQEEHDRLARLREGWRKEIQRWRLAEGDVRGLIAWLEAPPSKHAARSPAQEVEADPGDAVTQDEIVILRLLASRPQFRPALTDVLPDAGVRGRKAIGERVRRLHDLGYVHFPPRSRSGVSILPKGLEFLKSLDSQATRN
jgi:hypothetical protein